MERSKVRMWLHGYASEEDICNYRPREIMYCLLGLFKSKDLNINDFSYFILSLGYEFTKDDDVLEKELRDFVDNDIGFPYEDLDFDKIILTMDKEAGGDIIGRSSLRINLKSGSATYRDDCKEKEGCIEFKKHLSKDAIESMKKRILIHLPLIDRIAYVDSGGEGDTYGIYVYKRGKLVYDCLSNVGLKPFFILISLTLKGYDYFGLKKEYKNIIKVFKEKKDEPMVQLEYQA